MPVRIDAVPDSDAVGRFAVPQLIGVDLKIIPGSTRKTSAFKCKLNATCASSLPCTSASTSVCHAQENDNAQATPPQIPLDRLGYSHLHRYLRNSLELYTKEDLSFESIGVSFALPLRPVPKFELDLNDVSVRTQARVYEDDLAMGSALLEEPVSSIIVA